MTNNEEQILKKASLSIFSNTHKTSSGREFVATGANQFRTFWTRDFCYSVPGLLKIGKANLVKDQLSLIYAFRNSDNLLPRGIDRINPKLRVLFNTIFPKLIRPPFLYASMDEDFDSQIKGEYLGEHATISIDSNVLFSLAYFSYAETTQDYFLSPQQVESLFELYRVHLTKRGVEQPAFSDWQDSARREGVCLLLQVQILSALKKYHRWTGRELNPFSISDLETSILDRFYSKNENVFYQSLQSKALAIDAYGFIFTHQLFAEKLNLHTLYQALVSHPIWTKWMIPGVPVSEHYPQIEVSWTTKLVGLRGYHDHFHWGWIIAESARIAKMNSDLAEYARIVGKFALDTQEAPTLSEIYFLKDGTLLEYASILYRSENPFTWTSAKWCEAIL